MNSSILDKMGMDPAYIILGMLVLIIVLFIMIFVLIGNVHHRNKDLARLLKGATGEDLEEILFEKLHDVEAVKNNSKRLTREHKVIQSDVADSIKKIGLVKYDAFEGMSGNLSFALALLNSNNDGVVLNCMHSREGCFNYAKEIIRGESYVPLSEEEKEAINRAKTIEEELAEDKEISL